VLPHRLERLMPEDLTELIPKYRHSSAPPGEGEQTMAIRLKPRRDPMALLVAGTAAVLGVGAVVYFFRQNAILGYRDAYSHLEISRRILTGRSPGIAQLGGIWLPVPHILQAFFAWDDTLYRTGLAGSIVSCSCYIGSSVLVYMTIRSLTSRRRREAELRPGNAPWPALIGAAVFMANPNLLYQQSTPMDELPLYVFVLWTVYFLVRWAETSRSPYVLRAALCSMAAMMCRYEAWFLGLVFTVCVVVICRRTGHSWRDTRGLTLVFGIFGFLAPAGAWFLYNLVIFGTPTYFLTGPDSSSDQMASQQSEPEIHHWMLTLRAYAAAATSDLGLGVIAAGVLALVLLIAFERFSPRSIPVIGLALVVPFYTYTLWSGQEPISTPAINGGIYNFRFGLVGLLSAAILAGYLADRVLGWLSTGHIRLLRFPLIAVAGLAIAATCVQPFAKHQIVLKAEAVDANATQLDPHAAADFLQQDTTGPILIDTVQNELLAFPVLDRTIYAGTRDSPGHMWSRALVNPRANDVAVIVMRITPGDQDLVYKALHSSTAMAGYQEVYHNSSYVIYDLR
jgi:hypothetical protein